MPSTLSWIDHDPKERDRMQKVLSLFKERNTVDDLGLGAIRDTFSDRLFPGTSTIQTRLRYMLFIPWMYRKLEEEKVPSQRIAERGREFELALVTPLSKDDDPYGVFGISARGSLKRLPSTVYWSGLASWGIRRFVGSKEDYHQSLDPVYRRRKLAGRLDDGDIDPDRLTVTWHPRLPDTPPKFPKKLGLKLTRAEAIFLRERIVTSHPNSLLAFLALHGSVSEETFPWHHPDLGSFPDEQKELLEHGRIFSQVMFGAAALYNIMLAEKSQQRELKERHQQTFEQWVAEIEQDNAAIGGWDLTRFWALVLGYGHVVTDRAQQFVEQWAGLVQGNLSELPGNKSATDLIKQREYQMKHSLARLSYQQALDRWGGASGLTRFSYRWNVARSFLYDLHDGLNGRG